MFLGDPSHHSLERRSGHFNASSLGSKVYAGSRIWRIKQLGVHPLFITGSDILLASCLTVEHGGICHKFSQYRAITKEMILLTLPCMVWVV